jgi:hypothetical protein
MPQASGIQRDNFYELMQELVECDRQRRTKELRSLLSVKQECDLEVAESDVEIRKIKKYRPEAEEELGLWLRFREQKVHTSEQTNQRIGEFAQRAAALGYSPEELRVIWTQAQVGLTKWEAMEMEVEDAVPGGDAGVAGPCDEEADLRTISPDTNVQAAITATGRVSHNAKKRAMDVAKIDKELHIIASSIEAGQEDYDKIKKANPRFLTFKAVASSPQLQDRILALPSRRGGFLGLAMQLTCLLHQKSIHTIKLAWKRFKPASYKRSK